jgi:archaellum component FlaF (FlaF/FlaG flagellin family)
MRRLFVGRKGVSTVIANVLMVMTVFSLAAVMFAWATSSFGRYQGGIGVWFSNQEAAMRESLVIEDVWYNSTASTVSVTVRNTGSADLTISTIYFNGTSRSPTGSPTLPYNLKVGNAVAFKFSTTGWLSANKMIYVVVATAKGNQARGYWST